jgi:hypothetical protein
MVAFILFYRHHEERVRSDQSMNTIRFCNVNYIIKYILISNKPSRAINTLIYCPKIHCRDSEIVPRPEKEITMYDTAKLILCYQNSVFPKGWIFQNVCISHAAGILKYLMSHSCPFILRIRD